jgi:hypothetical protein
VVRSLPGLGTILGARVLGEFGDEPNRYANAKSRKLCRHVAHRPGFGNQEVSEWSPRSLGTRIRPTGNERGGGIQRGCGQQPIFQTPLDPVILLATHICHGGRGLKTRVHGWIFSRALTGSQLAGRVAGQSWVS